MAETAMSAAIQRAGGPAPAWARFEVALAAVMNAGFTTDFIRAKLDEIDELSGRGKGARAHEGQKCLASSRRQNGDAAGQFVPAADGGHTEGVLPSPTERDATGHPLGAANATSSMPDASHPSRDGGQFSRASDGQMTPALVREPNKPRGLAAIKSIQPTLAKSLFDSERLPDGRALGDVTWGELQSLARRYARWSRVFALLQDHAQADPTTLVRDAVTEDWMRNCIRIAELRNAE